MGPSVARYRIRTHDGKRKSNWEPLIQRPVACGTFPILSCRAGRMATGLIALAAVPAVPRQGLTVVPLSPRGHATCKITPARYERNLILSRNTLRISVLGLVNNSAVSLRLSYVEARMGVSVRDGERQRLGRAQPFEIFLIEPTAITPNLKHGEYSGTHRTHFPRPQ